MVLSSRRLRGCCNRQRNAGNSRIDMYGMEVHELSSQDKSQILKNKQFQKKI